jgi:hypothetical protein
VEDMGAHAHLIAAAEELLVRATSGTREQLREELLALYTSKLCMRGQDATSGFVADLVHDMCQEAQTIARAEGPGAVLERYRQQLQEGKQEVARRRNLLGPLTFVRLPKLQSPQIRRQDARRCLVGCKIK